MAETIHYRFLVRGGTAAALAARNEVPLARELVIETDTLKMKLGNGSTPYNDLPYITTGGGGGGIPPIESDANTTYNVDDADVGAYRVMTAASAKTINVRPNSTHALSDDYEQHFDNVGAGIVTFVAGSGVTIRAPAGGTLQVGQAGVVTLKRLGVNDFRLLGSTVPLNPTANVSTVVSDPNTTYDVSSIHNGLYRRMTATTPKTVNVRHSGTHSLPDNYEQHFDNDAIEDMTFVPASGVTIRSPSGGLKVPRDGVVTLKRLSDNRFRLIGVTKL